MATRSRAIGALAVAGLALLSAGCGGSDPGPSVASVSTTGATSQAARSGAGPSTSSALGGGKGGLHMVINSGRNAAALSSCMRKHGEPSFPDPDSSGAVSIDSSNGIDPNSPTFKAAQMACRKLLPHGGAPPSPAQQAQMQAQALKFSACMRSHGVPKFPDPTFSQGGVHIALEAGNGLDPSSPAFQAAQKACQTDLPGAPAGPPGSVGGP